VQDEVGVGGQDDAVQLERQPAGILAAGQLALRQRHSRETPQQHPELSLMLADQLVDRSGTGAQLQGPAGHETSAGERPALEIREERLAHRGQLRQAGRGGQRGLHDFLGEDPGRLGHGRQLEFGLGAEMRMQAALAHPHRGGHAGDGQALKPVHGDQGRSRAHDGVAGPFPVAAGPPRPGAGGLDSLIHRCWQRSRPRDLCSSAIVSP